MASGAAAGGTDPAELQRRVQQAMEAALTWEQTKFDEGVAKGAADSRGEAEADAVRSMASLGVAYGSRLGYLLGWATVLRAAEPLLNQRHIDTVANLHQMLMQADISKPDPDLLTRCEAQFRKIMSNLKYRLPDGDASHAKSALAAASEVSGVAPAADMSSELF
eukprot:TRINITY_DN33247_c0_g1_i1.p1 TRINITY_DN33247_c0_g1~~TRINITY_DN33247_c0_g1_i1.p1  ORF type:complete len:179 (+),score=54.13 TRINITY_DN33247_c0_g1_i1:47-538(+)